MTRKRTGVWASTPKAKRKRKPLEITLSERARVALETLAWNAEATLSATIEVLIITAAARASGGPGKTLLDDVDAHLAEKAELESGS